MSKTSGSLAAPAEGQTHERVAIKMVSAVIRRERLDLVKEALNKLNLVGGITLTEVRGFGRQKGSLEHYMGIPYRARLLDKIKIEMAVAEEDVRQVVTLISQLAHTGKVGDGKIFISEVKAVLRIRTGERGVSAL